MEPRNPLVSDDSLQQLSSNISRYLSYSDVNETVYFSLRLRTFLGVRTIIGTAELKREEILKNPGAEIKGT